MSAASLYIVRSTANVAYDSVTVWTGRGTATGTDVWQWEVLRVLWQAMGTRPTAAWVAAQYLQLHPDAAADIGSVTLTEAVRQALDQAAVHFPARA